MSKCPPFITPPLYSLLDLIYNFPAFGGLFHDYPYEFIAALDCLFRQCQDKIKASESKQDEQLAWLVKKRLDIKLVNVPPSSEVVAENIRDLSSKHLNKQIICFGTVVRTGNVRSRELIKKFKCRQCEYEVMVESDITEYNKFVMPQRCEGRVPKKENPFFNIAKQVINK